MKKNDIKDYMMVETGFDDKKYLVIKGKLIDDNLEGFSLEDDFNEELINDKNKPYSISRVYEPVELELPFELDIEKIFKEKTNTFKQNSFKRNEKIRNTKIYYGFSISMCNSRVIFRRKQ